jgi:hypothetical protein
MMIENSALLWRWVMGLLRHDVSSAICNDIHEIMALYDNTKRNSDGSKNLYNISLALKVLT